MNLTIAGQHAHFLGVASVPASLCFKTFQTTTMGVILGATTTEATIYFFINKFYPKWTENVEKTYSQRHPVAKYAAIGVLVLGCITERFAFICAFALGILFSMKVFHGNTTHTNRPL